MEYRQVEVTFPLTVGVSDTGGRQQCFATCTGSRLDTALIECSTLDNGYGVPFCVTNRTDMVMSYRRGQIGAL